MPIDFPNSPTTGDTYTVGDKTWTWDGTSWNLVTQVSFVGVNLDGGTPSSNYGGGTSIDAGGVS